MKINAAIKFIKSCKKENLIPTFAKVNVSIKSGSYKLKRKIARLIMNTELQNKHIQKQKLKKEIKKICTELKRTVSLIILNTYFHQINITLKSKLKKITKRHDTKLINLRRQQHESTFGITTTYVKNTLHNFSSYQLSNDELTALSYGLDHHIPSKINRNRIYTEFEQFYQSVLKDKSHVPDEDLSHLKTKLRNT